MIGRLLLALLGAVAATQPAHAEWREASTDHFVIYSEQGEESLREFATRLERFDKAMRFVLSVKDQPVAPSSRLTVYVVKDAQTVQKLAGETGANSRFRIGGFYIPRAGGSIAITPRRLGDGGTFDLNAETVLLHEYAHHFMLNTYPGAFPGWLIEGFAEFYSSAKFERDGGVGIGTPAMHRAYSLTQGQRLTADKMLTSSGSDLTPELRASLYARGWLLKHMLTFDPTRKGQLSAYIRNINKGVGALEAATTAFGDLKLLDRDLDRYLERRRMNYYRIPADKVKIGAISLRNVSRGEDAIMELKIRSRRGVSLAQAKELVPLMRRAAAPFPNDAFVQTTLAEAEFDANNYAEAEAAADRAIAADPKNGDALLYKARVQMALASKAGKRDNATWAGIRKLILAANRADTDDPEPLIFFYRSFLSQGIQPTANASDGLVTAALSAPQDRSLRMTAALQLLRDGKAPEARQMLAPIAYDPHAGKVGQYAGIILAKLAESGPKAALDASAVAELADEETEE